MIFASSPVGKYFVNGSTASGAGVRVGEAGGAGASLGFMKFEKTSFAVPTQVTSAARASPATAATRISAAVMTDTRRRKAGYGIVPSPTLSNEASRIIHRR